MERFQTGVIESGKELEDESNNKNFEYVVLEAMENQLCFANESESDIAYELETDNDSADGLDPDAVLDRVVRHIETKKRSERSSSFDHGFDFPSEVRKKIVLDKKLRKKKNKGKVKRVTETTKRKAKHVDKQNKPIRETPKNMNSNQRFTRRSKISTISRDSGLSDSQEQKQVERSPVPTKRVRFDDTILLSKCTAAHTETESSFLSKRAHNQSPVVPQPNVVPKNCSQKLKETDINSQWNVRQNSYSDLLLKHFDMISQTGRIIKLKCKLCGGRKRPISIVVGNNSNLKAHMKAVRSFFFV